MAEPLVLTQPDLGEDLEALEPALTGAFTEIRAALLAGRPVAIVVEDRDLLGQGTALGAALATALLGLGRALALEGVKPGWRVNAVSRRDGVDDALVEEAAAWLSASPLSGQLLRPGTAHLGKVSP